MEFNDECIAQIRQNQDLMYALAYSLLKNEQDAADAISETITRAYGNIGQLKKASAFKPWLLKILHNTALEMLRRRYSTVDIDDQYELEDERASGDIPTKLALREAVEKLSQPYRTAVILYYYEDMPIKEIAKVTDANEDTVKKRLSRGRALLRGSLSKEDFY